MKIYKISQDSNSGYDTYDSAVIIAKNAEDAKHACVCGFHKYHDGGLYFQYADGREEIEESCSAWCIPENVEVRYLGEAEEGSEEGIVCSSFNAG